MTFDSIINVTDRVARCKREQPLCVMLKSPLNIKGLTCLSFVIMNTVPQNYFLFFFFVMCLVKNGQHSRPCGG